MQIDTKKLADDVVRLVVECTELKKLPQSYLDPADGRRAAALRPSAS